MGGTITITPDALPNPQITITPDAPPQVSSNQLQSNITKLMPDAPSLLVKSILANPEKYRAIMPQLFQGPASEDELTRENRLMTAAMSGQTTTLSPEEKAQGEAGKKAGMISAASTVPMVIMPETWPLIGKTAAATGIGATTGALQSASEPHPSGRDILDNMAKQGALYGGSELGSGLLSRAFTFLKGLRGLKQASEASAAEAGPSTQQAPPVGQPPPASSAPPTGQASPTGNAPSPTLAASKPTGDIIAERLGILDKDPQSLITSALKPGTNNFKWANDMQTAFPNLKAAETELGRPIKTFDDAKQAVDIAKSNLWDQYESKLNQVKALGSNAPSLTNIDGNKIADAMVGSIDPRTAIQNPSLVQKINGIADTYRHPMSVDEAEQFLQSANNELNSYYAKNKVGQQVASRDPETGHVVAEANELRKQLYSKLDELTGPGSAQLKQQYGALSNFQDVLSKRENVALRQQPQSLAEQISKARAYGKIAVGIARGDPWSVYEGVQQSTAATWLKERQTSEAMMERAFANYGQPAAASGPLKPRTPSLSTLQQSVTPTVGQQQQQQSQP